MATIARALGLRDMGDAPLARRLIDLLGDHSRLLVLDNFEHVVTAGPRLSELLGACSGVTLLVTSRIRLRLSGERELPVAPLALPSPLADRSLEDPATSAVRLFIERAIAPSTCRTVR